MFTYAFDAFVIYYYKKKKNDKYQQYNHTSNMYIKIQYYSK